MTDILSKASGLVSGDRRADYVHPLDDFGATGKIWGAILSLWMGTPVPAIPAEAVGLMMIGLKLARESGRHKEDNLVDMAGYAQCVENVLDERVKRALDTETPRILPVAGSAFDEKPRPLVGEEIPHRVVPECYGTKFESNSVALLRVEFGCATCTFEPECNPSRRDPPSQAAVQAAAAVWCQPETSGIPMDTRLAMAFAHALDPWINRAMGAMGAMGAAKAARPDAVEA